METAPPIPPPSIVSTPHSLFTRLTYAARLWSFKLLVTVGLGFFRLVNRGKVTAIGPTYTKRYDIRPMLANRIFIPKTWRSGTKLPLYIDIHGGGFALCDPQTDDPFCHHFANQFNFCVVSINYRKAPSYPFPYSVDDAAEITRAILDDVDLPIDLSKVTLGGFSAGGNLSLAIAQMDGIRGRIGHIVAIYPVVDFSGVFQGSSRATKDGRPDMLQNTAVLFDWGYISQGQDRADPLLSPVYAKRENLPTKIFFVGAEHDILCHQAEVMALLLAGDGPNPEAGPEDSWDREGIKWRKILDVQHGFTQVRKRGQEEVERKKHCKNLYKEMADWLA